MAFRAAGHRKPRDAQQHAGGARSSHTHSRGSGGPSGLLLHRLSLSGRRAPPFPPGGPALTAGVGGPGARRRPEVEGHEGAAAAGGVPAALTAGNKSAALPAPAPQRFRLVRDAGPRPRRHTPPGGPEVLLRAGGRREAAVAALLL